MKLNSPFNLKQKPSVPDAVVPASSGAGTPPPVVEEQKSTIVTVPLIGLRLPRSQLILFGVMLTGLVVFQILRNGSSEESASQTFVAQTPVVQPQPAAAAPPPMPDIQAPPLPEPSAQTALPSPLAASPGLSDSGRDEEQDEKLASLRSWTANNREGLKALDARLRALESQIATLQAQRVPPAAKALPVTHAAPRRSASARHRSSSALKGAKVLSIYPGLAWVRWKGSTWALHPGDTLGTATVTAVDTAKREVVTTAGVLR